MHIQFSNAFKTGIIFLVFLHEICHKSLLHNVQVYIYHLSDINKSTQLLKKAFVLISNLFLVTQFNGMWFPILIVNLFLTLKSPFTCNLICNRKIRTLTKRFRFQNFAFCIQLSAKLSSLNLNNENFECKLYYNQTPLLCTQSMQQS